MNFLNSRNTEDHSSNSPRDTVRVQLLCPLPNLPDNLKSLLARKDVQCSWVVSFDAVDKHALLDEFNLVVLCPGSKLDVEQKRRLGKILQSAQQKNVPVILLSEDQSMINMVPIEGEKILPRIQTIDPDIHPEELWGRICSLLHYTPLFQRIEHYMGQLEKWAFTLNNRFEELHQELRLAWRVQQDFLPKQLPKSLKLRFAALYRPASWVSGDIYDIFQLDERHIGFYIADVVGHGVAAGLMTLFVKRALVTKEIVSNNYRLLPPNEALARLNLELSNLELPEHQFVTALYGIINVQTCQLTFARAGHPYPLLIPPGEKPTKVEMEGSLLGIFAEAQFPKKETQLAPGSKLFLFTDGLEQAFGDEKGDAEMLNQIARLSHLPADEMIDALAGVLDCQENSLHPADDITAVVIESLC